MKYLTKIKALCKKVTNMHVAHSFETIFLNMNLKKDYILFSLEQIPI